MNNKSEQSYNQKKQKLNQIKTRLFKGPWPWWFWVLIFGLGVLLILISISINPKLNDGVSPTATIIYTLKLNL